jgi:hypothetical protein
VVVDAADAEPLELAVTDPRLARAVHEKSPPTSVSAGQMAFFVELRRFELLTSSMRTKRSTN